MHKKNPSGSHGPKWPRGATGVDNYNNTLYFEKTQYIIKYAGFIGGI
jgi:hypothetical protein